LPHILWYQAKAARLKNEQDYNYSAESVFDTFPWPQFGESRDAREGGEPISRITVVAAAARELRRVRAEALPKLKGGLRTLYRTLELTRSRPLARPSRAFIPQCGTNPFRHFPSGSNPKRFKSRAAKLTVGLSNPSNSDHTPSRLPCPR
jgi:hypothetical protein